jgi:DNA-binding NarL/FixJ family response regulator
MKPIRLLLADDHTLFRKGLVSLLNQEKCFEILGEAENGREAVTQANEKSPDIVLMDIHMPGVNGLDATRQITKARPETRVVILTFSEEDQDVFEAIKSGAYGYLSKKITPARLNELLLGVARGEAPLSGTTASKILKEFAAPSSTSAPNSPVDELSEREREILKLLAEGLTNKEIGCRLIIAENTVKNHLKNILAKLHLRNRVQAAALALKEGLLPLKTAAS